MNNIIIDFRAEHESVNYLENLGFNIIPTIKLNNLHQSVCGHPDMMIHKTYTGKMICAQECFEYFKKKLPEYNWIRGSKNLNSNYPYDILYNCAEFGDYAICNIRYTAKELIEELSNKIILNVKQGYSKCNICVVNDNALITSDNGIAKISTEHNIDVLKIAQGYIELKGVDYGFIGGATGLISKDILAVNGSLKLHPDGDKIKKFCRNYGVYIEEIKSGFLSDIGTIYLI